MGGESEGKKSSGAFDGIGPKVSPLRRIVEKRVWGHHRHIGRRILKVTARVPPARPLCPQPAATLQVRQLYSGRRPLVVVHDSGQAPSALSMANAPTGLASRRTSPKSPPPPKLKLDEFKPILSTAVTNTSSNSSSNSSTAFVFTSSRTTRSGFSSPSASPATPPASPLSDPRHAPKSHPILSTSQLTKHSLGALDARCIVGPNMRAAGFVPLAHTLSPQVHSHHHSQSHPSLPSHDAGQPSPTVSVSSITSGVPTPSDPPPFPPIMFVNPSQMTSMPMWDYQRQLVWGVSQGRNSAGIGQSSSLQPAFEPVAALEVGSSVHASSSFPARGSSSSVSAVSSSTSIFSPVPTTSSMSTLPSISPGTLDNGDLDQKSPTRTTNLRHNLSPIPPVDGYPFPHTPPRSCNNETNSNSSSSTSISAYTTATEHTPASVLSRSPRLTASDYVGIAEPSSAHSSHSSNTGTVHSSRHSRTVAPADIVLPSRPFPVPLQEEDKKPPSFRQSTRILHDSRDKRSRSPSAGLSLTELCKSSSRGAWITDPNVFGPANTKHRRSASSSNLVSSSSSSGRASRGRSRTNSILGASDRNAAQEHRLSKDVADLSSEVATVSLTMESVREESSEDGPRTVVLPQNEAQKGREWARFKEAERKRKKGKEKRRNKTDSDSDGKADGGKGKLRSGGDKTTKNRPTAQAHVVSYSSFSFPPSSMPALAHDHGDVPSKGEPRERTKRSSGSRERREREREHQRGKDLSALVQAHRLHDREQAKQSERENRSLDLQRAIPATGMESRYGYFDQSN